MLKHCKSIEELKKEYFRLALKNHPDKGGDAEVMKALNNEYEEMQKLLKDVHFNAKTDEVYESKEKTSEVPQDFINIVNELFKMGLDVELCGRWLWISGDTKSHKDELKALGCRWCSKKKLWSWHYPEDSKKGRKSMAMNDIRNIYGSQILTEKESVKRIA